MKKFLSFVLMVSYLYANDDFSARAVILSVDRTIFIQKLEIKFQDQKTNDSYSHSLNSAHSPSVPSAFATVWANPFLYLMTHYTKP